MNTNAERAAKADRVVSNYETDSSLEECLSDLLGDLRHFCDKHGIDFAERDGVGYRNYVAEIGEERRKPEAEPAYTVVGRYRDNDQTYVVTVYTYNGTKAAVTLARQACSEESEIPLDELDLEIVAVFDGEPTVAARGDEAEL